MNLSPITVATAWDNLSEPDGARVFVPALARFPADLRELMALLPVVDINGGLLAALAEARGEPAPGAVAGLFAVDPFLVRTEMIAALRGAGLRGVANFPTLQLFDGATAAGFGIVGYDLEAELAVLTAFAQAGFEVLAYVTTPAAASQALAAGISSLAYHPGLPPAGDERAALIRIGQIVDEAGATLLRHTQPISP